VSVFTHTPERKSCLGGEAIRSLTERLGAADLAHIGMALLSV